MSEIDLMDGEVSPEEITNKTSQEIGEKESNDNESDLQEVTSEEIEQEEVVKDNLGKEVSEKDEKYNVEEVEENKKKDVKKENDEESTEEVEVSEEVLKYNKKLSKLTDDLSKSNSWGHNKNRLLTGGLKGLKSQLGKLVEDNHIFQEDADNLLNCFDLEKIESSKDEENTPKQNEHGLKPMSVIESEVKKELDTFMKYNSDTINLDYFNCFFDNLSAYDKDKRIEIYDYLNSADTIDSLKFILHEGNILNDTIAEPLKKHGNVLNYIQSLKTKIEKLESSNKKRDLELEQNSDYEDSKYIPPKTTTVKKGKYDSYEQLFSL